jgi:hypothetical protein
MFPITKKKNAEEFAEEVKGKMSEHQAELYGLRSQHLQGAVLLQASLDEMFRKVSIF